MLYAHYLRETGIEDDHIIKIELDQRKYTSSRCGKSVLLFELFYESSIICGMVKSLPVSVVATGVRVVFLRCRHSLYR